MGSPIEPFATLLDMAQRSVAAAQGLPAQKNSQPEWSGIGFRLVGHRFVAPMGEIVGNSRPACRDSPSRRTALGARRRQRSRSLVASVRFRKFFR